jgi:hypothetical protein
LAFVIQDRAGHRDANVQISSSAKNVTLSWPAKAADFVFEAATSLSADSRAPVTSAPTINETHRSVQLPVNCNAQFFPSATREPDQNAHVRGAGLC